MQKLTEHAVIVWPFGEAPPAYQLLFKGAKPVWLAYVPRAVRDIPWVRNLDKDFDPTEILLPGGNRLYVGC